jgi:hypothetical protein
MADDLTLSTPLGQAKDPGPPPAPGIQGEPAEPTAPKMPTDVQSWYWDHAQKIIPKFDEAVKSAHETIASQQRDLAAFKAKSLGAPGLPESPELPPAPEAPKITARPFLASVPGEDAVTSLNKLMAGLGLMAQMGVGIKGGYPTGALAAYQGALEGWQAGDQHRAANQFQTFMGQLKQYDRDVNAIRAKYEDAIRKYGADQDRLKMEFGILSAEHGNAREASELAFRDPLRAFEQVNAIAKNLTDMQNSASTLALRNLEFYENKTIRTTDLALKIQEAARKEREHAENQALVKSIFQGGAGGQGGFEVSSIDPVSGKVMFAPRKGPEASERKDIAQMNALITLGTDLSADWKAKPSLMPTIRQRLQEREMGMGIRPSDVVGSSMTPEQRTFFANATDLMAAYRAIRSGLAVTNPEALRSAPLVPDDPGALRQEQLDAIIGWASRNRTEIGRALEAAGRTPGPNPQVTERKPPSTKAVLSQDQYGALKARGYSDADIRGAYEVR